MKRLLILLILLALAPISYAQDDTGLRTGELFAHKLIVNEKCAYSLLDTIDYCWKHSILDDKPSFALLDFTDSYDWKVQILQLSIGNYLFLKGHLSCFFGALRYQNKLYVLHCLDSLGIEHAQKLFLQSPDSIKILPDHRTFLQSIQNYQFVVDTIPSADNNVLEWEILTYERFIQLLCRKNDNCFQCKEIPLNK
ncbi:MAG: hypothetical protein IKU03_04290 [Bacteroidales bacterium]|nr:hypothetical protein [Bacteroidales bacterium]